MWRPRLPSGRLGAWAACALLFPNVALGSCSGFLVCMCVPSSSCVTNQFRGQPVTMAAAAAFAAVVGLVVAAEVLPTVALVLAVLYVIRLAVFRPAVPARMLAQTRAHART
jgi:hypothetical protein